MRSLSNDEAAEALLQPRMNSLQAGVDRCSTDIQGVSQEFDNWRKMAEELSTAIHTQLGKVMPFEVLNLLTKNLERSYEETKKSKH